MSKVETKQDADLALTQKPKNFGARNLFILSLSSTIIALITTSISLFIYHETGDIFLDRSRPGFISELEHDEKENTEEAVLDSFSPDGHINSAALEQYLKDFDKKVETAINKYNNAFSEAALSDDALNLTFTNDEHANFLPE